MRSRKVDVVATLVHTQGAHTNSFECCSCQALPSTNKKKTEAIPPKVFVTLCVFDDDLIFYYSGDDT